MRIPRSKPWRAFPELDRFSDRVCRAYLRTATSASWVTSPRVVYPALLLLGLILWVGVTIAGWWGMWLLGQSVFNPSPYWALLLIGVLPVVVAAGVPILLRDFWLRKRLAAQLTRCACSGCGYSLLGLTPTPDANGRDHVDCPECGARIDLAEHGLNPSDLLPKAA
jgi:ribosomal protein S27AE